MDFYFMLWFGAALSAAFRPGFAKVVRLEILLSSGN
jgi:hypothetical protein